MFSAVIDELVDCDANAVLATVSDVVAVIVINESYDNAV